LDYYLRPYHTIKHLDRCVGVIASEKKLEVALFHLIDPESYWQGYSEIEVAAYVKKQFGNISLEPLLPRSKSVDMKYVFNDQNYFVEVTAPKSYYKFQEKMEESAKTGKAVTLEDATSRASEKILAEVEHFKGILDDFKSIIIMNVNGSEFDGSEIEDSLLSVSKLVVLKDPKTDKFLGTKVTRDPWTSFQADEDLKKIGLIVTYKRDFALNGTVEISKKLFVISFSEDDFKPLEKLF
jgi:hypothetical protein